ncbi:MAG: glycoside hydrolase family 2, partial [Oscillospiraceae bacterium]|nr:glycoside hydrolase family 2 [Oscillospiraceae bacterium]
MQKTDFNRGWVCRCLTREEAPCPVTLPHDAMRSEDRTNASAGEGNTGWYIGGDYEYAKRFPVPADWRGQRLLLEFEAVYRNAEVWINGEKAAFRPYGYTNFYVDPAPFLRYGEDNEIRVVARNADQPNSRWYPGTGIYRPVWLWMAGEAHIPVNGLRVRTMDYQEGTVEVTVQTSQPGEVTVEIGEENGGAVVSAQGTSQNGRAIFHLKLPNVKLWDCDTPNLYWCRASFGGDTAEETFGVRTLGWGGDGLTINGKRVILRGACVHHDNGLLGACSFPEAEARRVRILKENGYNALRSSHYPCSKALLDACDRQGMLMMDEYVDHWYIHKTKYDYVEHFMDWWKQDLKDMADKDYNHPCVILYSTGNEVAETAQEKGVALTGEMTRYLHQVDGTRPVTCGINIFFNFLSSVGLGVYSDDKAEKSAAVAEKPKKDPKKKPMGSEFYNTLACLMGDWFM